MDSSASLVPQVTSRSLKRIPVRYFSLLLDFLKSTERAAKSRLP